MKRRHLFRWIVLCGLLTAGLAAAQSELLVKRGRIALQAYNQPPHEAHQLRKARDLFAQAVTASPEDAEAVILLTATRFLYLLEDPEFNRLLTQLGVSEEGRDPWNWKAGLQHPFPLVSLTSDEAMDRMESILLPHLDEAREHLQRIPAEWDGTVMLQTNEVPLKKVVEIDFGEVGLTRAIIHAARAALRIRDAYDTHAGLNGYIETGDDGHANFGDFSVNEKLKEYSNLFNITNAAVIAEAYDELSRAAKVYREAAAWIRAERDPQGDDLITATLLANPDQWAESMQRPVSVELARDFKTRVSFRQLFTEPYADRSLLPKFTSINDPRLGTFPTPQMNGLFPDMTQEKLTEWLRWFRRWSRVKVDLFDVLYANGRFFAVGDQGVILSSPRGVNWTRHTSGTEKALRSVAAGSGVMVAVGRDGAVLWSTDGAQWQAADTPGKDDLEDVAFAKGLFVAVGHQGAVWISADGRRWSKTAGPVANTLYAVTAGPDRWVVAGSAGTLLYSPDGRSWLPAGSPGKIGFADVAYGREGFLAVGKEFDDQGKTRPVMLHSSNGADWKPVALSTDQALSAVAFCDDRFIAVGTKGEIQVSQDGRKWHREVLNSRRNVFAAAANEEMYLVAGARGQLYSSYRADRQPDRNAAPRPMRFGLEDIRREYDFYTGQETRRFRDPEPARAGPSLKLAASRVPTGGTVAVRIENFPAEGRHPSAWIGFYRKDAGTHKNYIRYTFLNNLAEDTYDVTAPDEPGMYQFRLFRDGDYHCVATSGDVTVE